MSKLQQTLIPIKLEESRERLTSMAGLMLVEEAARSHGIWKPCGQIEANAVFFVIGVLAYNLGLILKAQLLPAEYRHTTVATLLLSTCRQNLWRAIKM